MHLRQISSILIGIALSTFVPWLGPNAISSPTCPASQHCIFVPLTRSAGATFDYAISRMVLPSRQSLFAIDLNGDGQLDNQFGNIFGTLNSLGFNLQANLDQAVANGTVVYLTQLQSQVADLIDDPAARVTWFIGSPTIPDLPDFTGEGGFAIDRVQLPSLFAGVLQAAHFSSANPIITTAPVSLTLQLALFSSTDVFFLPLQGAHVQFRANTDTLVEGELHGSIRNSD